MTLRCNTETDSGMFSCVSARLPHGKSYVHPLKSNALVAVQKERMFWAVVVKNTDTQADRTGPAAALKGTAFICPAELCDSGLCSGLLEPSRPQLTLGFGFGPALAEPDRVCVRAHTHTAVAVWRCGVQER